MYPIDTEKILRKLCVELSVYLPVKIAVYVLIQRIYLCTFLELEDVGISAKFVGDEKIKYFS